MLKTLLALIRDDAYRTPHELAEALLSVWCVAIEFCIPASPEQSAMPTKKATP